MSKKVNLLGAIPVVALLLIWELCSQQEWINPGLFPAPTAIFKEMANLLIKGWPFQSTLLINISTTLLRLLSALIAGTCLGLLLGVLMGINNQIFHFFNPLISVLMPIPGLAFAPLFILWLGFGNPTIITLGAMSAFFPMVFSTAAGVRSVDRHLVWAARMMGAKAWQVITKIYLPAASGFLVNGFKLGIARGWMTVIAVEFVAATNWGLGYDIWTAAEFLRVDRVYGGIFLMILVYWLMDRLLVRTIENRTIKRWGMVSQK